MNIVQAGDPVLRRRARTLTAREIASNETQQLIATMREVMYEAPGVGLAAPQIGVPVQLAVIEDREEYLSDVSAEELAERERRVVPFHAIINPRIIAKSDDTAVFYEGCLSLTDFMALVPRSRTVDVECLDERGNRKVIRASGWYARILQHEIDHLYGGLYMDRMHSRTFMSMENWRQFYKHRPISEVRAELLLDDA